MWFYLNRLKQLRTERRLSIQQLGEKVGIDYSTISRLESEKRLFTLDHLTRLSQFFDCSFDYILGKSDERKPNQQKAASNNQELDSLQIALLAHTKDLSEQEQQQVIDFIEFIKSKKKQGE